LIGTGQGGLRFGLLFDGGCKLLRLLARHGLLLQQVRQRRAALLHGDEAPLHGSVEVCQLGDVLRGDAALLRSHVGHDAQAALGAAGYLVNGLLGCGCCPLPRRFGLPLSL